MEKVLDDKLDKEVKDVRDRLDKGFKDAREKYESTRKIVEERQEEIEERIKAKPVEWVAGAFVAGLLLGKLLSGRD
ncbi:MAG: hypothetical protein JW724_01815 [Candidatus Altiarchaeota archaeon]|nr:hypothetical protein [Candidatus Altiarchaeota archaeon]